MESIGGCSAHMHELRYATGMVWMMADGMIAP